MPGGPYIDPAKAAHAINLREAGYDKSTIARETGISWPTVHDIIRGVGRWAGIVDTPVFKALREDQNRKLEAAFRAAAMESIDLAHSPEKLEKASYYQLVIGSSVEIDKARLLAGESTQNVEIHHHVEVEGLDVAADRIAHSLLRFSQDSNTVSSPQNEPIDVTPEPNNIRSDGKDK